MICSHRRYSDQSIGPALAFLQRKFTHAVFLKKRCSRCRCWRIVRERLTQPQRSPR